VIRTAADTASQTYFTQLRTKEQALNTALRANPVDSAAVTALRADITSIQSSITKVHTDATTQEVATLSPAQQAKVATLAAAVALRDQIEGAARLGLIANPGGGPSFGGGPGGRGPGGGKGKGGPPPR
jgi:Spy/CpxP family protein refolding chaperone